MAEQTERRERKIPVFSVWKNNVILKNIFLINAPPSLDGTEPHPENQEAENGKTHREFEETLAVGRHPDCDIRVEHPSVSRFHLRIHSIPSKTLLFLTDLSSVHGTWVSGKRIEPNVRTRLDEADTLRIGGSSRIYKLHWIPLSQAYDMEHPFVPPLDFPEPHEDDEEEEDIIKHENGPELDSDVHNGLETSILCQKDGLVTGNVVTEGLSLQKDDTGAAKNENTKLVDPHLEAFESLFGDENSNVGLQMEITQGAMRNENLQELANKDSRSESCLQDENSEMYGQEEVQMQNEDSNILEKSLGSLFGDENCNVSLQKEITHTVIQNENSQVLVNEDSGSESWSQDENSEPCPQKEIQIQDENSKNGLGSLFGDENSDVPRMQHKRFETVEIDNQRVSDGLMPLLMGENWEWVGQQNHSASPAKEYIPIPFKHEDEGAISSVLDGLDGLVLDDTSNEHIPSARPIPDAMAFSSAEMILENENQSPLLKDVQDGAWNFWYRPIGEPLSPPVEEILSEPQNPNLDKENQCPEQRSDLTALSEIRSAKTVLNDNVGKDSKLWSFWSGNMGVESVCSSLSDAEAFSESENRLLRNCYQSPEPLSSGKKQFGSPLLISKSNSALSIWSRRGKQASVPHILTASSKQKKTNTDQKKFKDEPISRALFHELDDQDEEEIFTPDKENFTPNTHKSMRKMAVLKEAKDSISAKSSLQKMTGCSDINYDDGMSPASDKENYSPKVLEEQKTVRSTSVKQVSSLSLKERRGERVPFQTLLADSPQKSVSETCIPDVTIRSGKSINCGKDTTKDKSSGERTHNWIMVVDANTLLSKESRKALQLLAGLKGTQLVIPRIVIRELDCLKQQVSFFRRNSEVLSALEWIQECMAETQWWIHVQRSMDEGLPVAPTPPANPHSRLSFGSAFESRPELLTPTAEDHVLDYALCFKKTKSDGQLVLLSNDITLKIKAMAEGLICEGAEEFRESLVNPFSERFLWADSSPRGQTWSCSDDVVLKKKFYPSSLKMMTTKAIENAKGLKLILLHNSQYFERMTSIR